MSIITTWTQKENLTIHTVSGLASEEDMYRALAGDGNRETTAFVLWDMSRAEVAHVTSDILRRFIRKATELGEARQGGRTAVVAPEDLQFGLARMSEVFSEEESSPFGFRAFRTRAEALLWLQTGKVD